MRGLKKDCSHAEGHLHEVLPIEDGECQILLELCSSRFELTSVIVHCQGPELKTL